MGAGTALPWSTTTPDAARMNNRWAVAACSGLGMFLVALDVSVNVALPTITSHFDTDIQTIQWIIVSFVATRAGLGLAAGSFGDVFGLKRVFLLGILCYTVAVTGIAFSPALGPIFALRVLQGIGAGSLFAAGPAIAGRAFSREQRGMAMGMATGNSALGTLAGTLGTGYLVGIFGWEIAFLGRVPFCVLAFVLGWLVLKEDSPTAGHRSFDVLGSGTLVGATVALVLALHMGGRSGWGSPQVIVALAASPPLFGLFVYSELKAVWPVLDLRLLLLPAFRAACSGMFFIQLGAFVIWFVFPFYVAEALGRGPLALGVMMALMAAAMSFASAVSGWLSDHIPPRHVGLAGACIVAGGLGWMSMLDGESSTAEVGMRIAAVGLGLGSFQAAAYSMVLKSMPAGRFGTGSGSLSLSQSMGSVLSVALGGLAFALWSDQHTAALAAQGLPGESIAVEALVLAFQDTFRLGAYLATAGIGVLLLAHLGSRASATELEERTQT